VYLGIEIGGTKLQLGVGPGDGTLAAELVHEPVDREAGAAGIRARIARFGRELIERHGARRIGIGFGGPIDAASGRTIKSHQIDGWDDYPLTNWCRETLGLPAVLGNDADLAALAEARFGAGQGCDPVFYVTVGTGIGGGFVRGGRLYAGFGPAASEIGHLRPGLNATDPRATVESIASGLALEAAAKAMFGASGGDFRKLVGVGVEAKLTPRELARGAELGNSDARKILEQATAALGWAIAQIVTLLAPQVVVVGGGVPLVGDQLFYEPLRRAVDQYVFPPLLGKFEIRKPKLEQAVVVHGALALAAGM
jgi:glucokinase